MGYFVFGKNTTFTSLKILYCCLIFSIPTHKWFFYSLISTISLHHSFVHYCTKICVTAYFHKIQGTNIFQNKSAYWTFSNVKVIAKKKTPKKPDIRYDYSLRNSALSPSLVIFMSLMYTLQTSILSSLASFLQPSLLDLLLRCSYDYTTRTSAQTCTSSYLLLL